MDSLRLVCRLQSDGQGTAVLEVLKEVLVQLFRFPCLLSLVVQVAAFLAVLRSPE